MYRATWVRQMLTPLMSHIFVSRRSYRNVSDSKVGECREMIAAEFSTPELGFRGCLDEWQRLMEQLRGSELRMRPRG
jgi:hypothetical protein